MELPIQFIYTENEVEKTSVDENKRMNYIDDLNRRLLDRKGNGRQRTTKIEDDRSSKHCKWRFQKEDGWMIILWQDENAFKWKEIFQWKEAIL